MDNNNSPCEKPPDQDEIISEQEEIIKKRPSSFLENIQNKIHNNSSGDQKLLQSPSQAICLSTTVPQNIMVQRLGGKHAPTRNSLRHSRMIVLNRSGRIPTKYLPTIIKYRRLAKAVVVLTILLGCLLGVVSLFLQLWAPNLSQTDNPYWSAILVVIAGVTGAMFICFCPKEYPGRQLHWFFYSIKYVSVICSIVAIAGTFITFIFAAFHLINLSNSKCTSSDKLDTACICTPKNDTLPFIKSYHYVDLNCVDVNFIMYGLIWCSCVVNVISCLVQILYLVLHFRRRYTYTYAKVLGQDNGFIMNGMNESVQ